MPDKQATIAFQVRRSRRSSVIGKQIESPKYSTKKRSKVNKNEDNPPFILSPSKRKNNDTQLDEVEIISPLKVVREESNTSISPSKVRRKLLISTDSPPQSKLIAPNNTPIKVDIKPLSAPTPRRLSAEIYQRLSSPQKNVSPLKSSDNSQNILAQSNLKSQYSSPLKESQNIYLESPKISRNAGKENNLTPQKKCTRSILSPISNTPQLLTPAKSSVKLKENSCQVSDSVVLKSPKTDHLILSPRRSPRKHVLTPSKYSSPSTLVKRLTLDSPKSSPTVIGLCKPNIEAYKSLRQTLSTSNQMEIVCRETQIKEISDFFSENLDKNQPSSLYVSGAPGTGKTACLTKIMKEKKMTGVRKVFVNCMTVKTSNQIYEMIAESLKLNAKGEKEVLKAIEKCITTSKKAVLVILDEIDQLDSRHHDVLYKIFEWPALPNSKIVLIGIANALDLTDRVLPRLQASSCKPQLLNFPPYSKTDIVKIINDRIQAAGDTLGIIKPGAVQFLATKVASVAGDVRKALDVCRRAVEMCEVKVRTQARLTPKSPIKSPRKSNKVPCVDIMLIHKIFNEVYGSRVMSALNEAPDSFSIHQKILICSLLLIFKHSKAKDFTLGKFHEVFTKVCKKRQLGSMDQGEFLSMCTLLEARGMVSVKKHKETRLSKITLRLNPDETEQALGDKKLLLEIMADKECLSKLK